MRGKDNAFFLIYNYRKTVKQKYLALNAKTFGGLKNKLLSLHRFFILFT
jgi:hypothetical protein